MTEAYRPRPAHLAPQYAAQFGDEAVAAAYRHRPPYPQETFAVLEPLLGPRPRTVLELGAGTGDLTIGLAPLADRLIAVEPSRAMVERGRPRLAALPSRVEWHPVSAEDYAFDQPYGAVVSAEAFHWLDWDRVVPLIAGRLARAGHLILVERTVATPLPWDRDLRDLIRTSSNNRDYVPYDIATELQSRGLVVGEGHARTAPVVHSQTLTTTWSRSTRGTASHAPGYPPPRPRSSTTA